MNGVVVFPGQLHGIFRNFPELHLNVTFADIKNPKAALEFNRFKLIEYKQKRSFESLTIKKEFRP